MFNLSKLVTASAGGAATIAAANVGGIGVVAPAVAVAVGVPAAVPAVAVGAVAVAATCAVGNEPPIYRVRWRYDNIIENAQALLGHAWRHYSPEFTSTEECEQWLNNHPLNKRNVITIIHRKGWDY